MNIEQQWVRRNRGTVGTQEQRNSGWNSGYRGTLGTEEEEEKEQ